MRSSLELDICAELDSAGFIGRWSTTKQETVGLHVLSVSTKLAGTTLLRAWLEIWVIECVEHFSLEGKVDAFTNRNTLRDGQVFAVVARSVQKYSLADGSGSCIRRDKRRVRRTTRSASQVLRVDEVYAG